MYSPKVFASENKVRHYVIETEYNKMCKCTYIFIENFIMYDIYLIPDTTVEVK